MSEYAATEVIIVGAGGFGREVAQYARDALDPATYNLVGALDDRTVNDLLLPSGLSYLGTIRDHVPARDRRYLLAIGEPNARASIARQLLTLEAKFLTLVHPRSYVAHTANLGLGCIVAPFATIGANARIGDFAHLHFYSSAAHDVQVGDFATLSPYAVANGGATLEEGAFLGTRATVNPLKSVGKYARVASGAVLYRDAPAWSLAAGNPAKARRILYTNDATSPTEDPGSS